MKMLIEMKELFPSQMKVLRIYYSGQKVQSAFIGSLMMTELLILKRQLLILTHLYSMKLKRNWLMKGIIHEIN